MIYICVICMVKRPPLSPLAAEHRTLLEAIVSPVINTEELIACRSQWLLCTNCSLLMQSVQNFQQTALIGIKNLKCLLHTLKTEQTVVEDTKHMVTSIKIEAGPVVSAIAVKEEFITFEATRNIDSPTGDLVVKFELETPEPELQPEFEPQCDLESTVSYDLNLNAPNEQPAASVSTPKIRQFRLLPKLPVTAGSEKKFEVFTHKPPPSRKPPIASVRRKEAAREPSQINTRKKPVRVTCPHCGKSMRDSCSLKGHISRLHGDAAPCKCDICGRQLRNEFSLKHHKYNHTREIPKNRDKLRPEFFCKQCCIQFPSPSAYKSHLQTLKHTPREQYAFQCETCKRRFLDAKRLKMHIDVVHLSQKKHKCDKCDKSFGLDKTLRNHIAVAHEKRAQPTHICHQCGKTFTIRKSLKEHLLTHEGLRPNQCPLCPANFTYKAALFTHNRLKHLKIKGKWKKKGAPKKEGVAKEKVEKEDRC